MNLREYEKGLVKVVWINEIDPLKVYSKMFTDEKLAVRFSGNKKTFLIFGLEKQTKMEEFSWRILPFGKYKEYLTLIKGYFHFKNPLVQL